jgi:hypothetical protein
MRNPLGNLVLLCSYNCTFLYLILLFAAKTIILIGWVCIVLLTLYAFHYQAC